MKKDFKILTEIGNLLYKEKNKPNKFIENDFKNISLRGVEQEVDSIKNRNDVIYQYLKTFSIFNKRKNGIFIKYNKYISYNFNSKNILLRGVEPQTNKSLKTIENIGKDPKININKVNGFNKELNRLKNVSVLTGYNQSANNRLIKYSYKLLFYFFKSMYCLISKPVFLFTPDKVTIQLFYYLNIPKFKVFKWYSILNNKLIRPSSDLNLSNKNNVLSYSNKEMMNKVKLSWRIKKTLFRLNKKRNKVKNILFNLNKLNLFKVFSIKFKLICEILSNKFKKPIELQLIRIHHPFHDSNILVNLLSLNIKNKKFKTNVAIEKLYAKKTIKSLYDYNIDTVNFIPTFLSGIKIRIGGRLMREPIIPRITTKNFERGASSPGKVNFLDTATINKKNKKGSYTIKISSGQNFF
jgi:Mitochondrial ribosomal protein (VAR1)